MSCPTWSHVHGFKMRIKQLDIENKILVIAASAARVVFTMTPGLFSGVDGWLVEWEIVQSTLYNLGVKGRTKFTNEDLKAAFGLFDHDDVSSWLIKQYRVQAANQGRFIRFEEFLNIPGPGTGHDGDPNISIFVDEEMQNAIRLLVG